MNRTIDFTIKGNSYKIEFPSAGQFVDIELLKASMSKGNYGRILGSGTVDGNFALDVLDVEAYIAVLCPDLKKDLRIDSLRELSLQDSVEVIMAFKEQVVTFISEWREVINSAYLKKNDKMESED